MVYFERKICLLIALLYFCCFHNFLKAQNCNNDSSYFSVVYKGTTNNNFISSVITSQDEVVALGQLSDNGNFVTKFTQQGNVLWSYQYQTNYKLVSYYQFPWYTNLVFYKVILGSDSTYYLIGSVIEHGSTANNTETPAPHKAGVLLKIDKFGNIVWSKNFGTWGTQYSIENLLVLNNGGLLIYLASYADFPTNRILCLNTQGNIIWATPLVMPWPSVSGSTHAMKQLSNGNFVIGDMVVRNRTDTLVISPPPFYQFYVFYPPLYYFNFFGLDGTTGKILWDQNYRCPTDTNYIPKSFTPDIKNICELPGGNFSFLADVYMPNAALNQYTNKVVNMITDSNGLMQNIIAYHEPANSCGLIDAQNIGTNGEQLFLARDNTTGKPILSQIDKDGNIEWTKAYGNASSGLPASYGLQNTADKRFFILLSEPQSPNLQLLISNIYGDIPCAQTPSAMIAENTTWPWKLDQLQFLNQTIGIDFGINALNMASTNYSLQSNVDCKYQYVCCTDFIDTTNITQVPLCEGRTFILPDSTVVSSAGRYYVTFQTTKGCDSTVFFDVTVSKNPSELSLVKD